MGVGERPCQGAPGRAGIGSLGEQDREVKGCEGLKARGPARVPPPLECELSDRQSFHAPAETSMGRDQHGRLPLHRAQVQEIATTVIYRAPGPYALKPFQLREDDPSPLEPPAIGQQAPQRLRVDLVLFGKNASRERNGVVIVVDRHRLLHHDRSVIELGVDHVNRTA